MDTHSLNWLCRSSNKTVYFETKLKEKIVSESNKNISLPCLTMILHAILLIFIEKEGRKKGREVGRKK